MLKVAVADDENIVRIGLQALFDWEENGFELAGLFGNGQEVLDYCTKNSADILITDIKMPVVDGIELIKKIKKIQPDIYIIVLSNYDDFHLVSDAFKLGIYDYVLKQFIEPENLLKLLNSIKAQIAEKVSSIDSASLHDTHGLREKKEDFLRSLLFTKALPLEETIGKIRELGLSIKPRNLYCLFLKMSGNEDCDSDWSKIIHHLAFNICTVVYETAGRYCSAEYIMVDRNSIALILSFSGNVGEIMDKKLEDLANDLVETFLSIFGIEVYIGCSKYHQTVSELNDAYIEAVDALEDSFFKTGSRIFRYTGKKYDAYAFNIIEIKKSINAALKFNDLDRLFSIINGFFDKASAEMSVSPKDFKRHVIEIIDQLDFYLVEAYDTKDLLPNGGLSPAQAILGAVNIGYVRKYLDIILNRLSSAISENSACLSFIPAARKYIDENYMNDIGLNEISKQLKINSNYLCRLFKEKTGENITFYIARTRIEKSIGLMAQSSLTTDEIAERVGYPNTNYYVRVFKKVTGKTISEFKNKIP